jgi:D-sedoheptulose 7-phosphate isomerase
MSRPGRGSGAEAAERAPGGAIGTALREALAEHRSALDAVGGMLGAVQRLADEMCRRFDRGGVLYTFGNGGSAADAQHLTGEMIGRYLRERRPLPAVSLATDPSVITCIANDYAYQDTFARQVRALAGPDDMVAGFTTSGSSPSVVQGLRAGRDAGSCTIAFTGAGGSDLATECHHAFVVPSRATARVQEMHTVLLHLISDCVDRWATGED